MESQNASGILASGKHIHYILDYFRLRKDDDPVTCIQHTLTVGNRCFPIMDYSADQTFPWKPRTDQGLSINFAAGLYIQFQRFRFGSFQQGNGYQAALTDKTHHFRRT